MAPRMNKTGSGQAQQASLGKLSASPSKPFLGQARPLPGVKLERAYAAFCEEVGYPPRLREKLPLVQTCKKCNSPSAMPVCHRCKLLRLKRFTGIAKHNAVNRIHWSKQLWMKCCIGISALHCLSLPHGYCLSVSPTGWCLSSRKRWIRVIPCPSSRWISLPVTLVELCGVGQREDRGMIITSFLILYEG